MSNMQYRLQLDATAKYNLVPDPGNAGTIDCNRHFDGVCELTGGSGAQTRVLPAAGSFPVGMKLMLVKTSGAGAITVTQAGSLQFNADAATSVVLSAIGSAAMVEVLYDASGDRAWRLVTSDLAATDPSAHIVADPGDGNTITPDPLLLASACLVTDSALGAETRVLAAAANYTYGTRLTVIYGGNGGSEGITVTQAGGLAFDLDADADIVLSGSGAWAEFVIGSNASGAKAWRYQGANLEASEV